MVSETSTPRFQFPLDESFPHLDHAPIDEAVIHFRTSHVTLPPKEELRALLLQRVASVSVANEITELQVSAQVGPGGDSVQRESSWIGFRLETPEGPGKRVIQVFRNGLAFSQLAPYPHWEAFCAEALAAWSTYREIANPKEIDRLGVRFISKSPIGSLEQIPDVLTFPPKRPQGMEFPLSGFLFQSQFRVPGHPLGVSITRTVQPLSPDRPNETGLVLDIDVATSAITPVEGELLDLRLKQMRWLKNKAFFGSITPAACELFK